MMSERSANLVQIMCHFLAKNVSESRWASVRAIDPFKYIMYVVLLKTLLGL